MKQHFRTWLWIIGVLLVVSICIAIGGSQQPTPTVSANLVTPSSTPSETYVSEWNMCIENQAMDDLGTRFGTASTDVTSHNYLDAITQVEAAQTDIAYAQESCIPSLETTGLDAQLLQVNSLTVDALTDMSSSLSSVLNDMQNADYGDKLTSDILSTWTGVNKYNKARQLIAAWQSVNLHQ